jgi:hypothetical protein
VSARTRRGATRTARSAIPLGPVVPSAAELAAAVLNRTWPETAAGPARSWRGRSADEAVLLVELCRWLEGRGRHRIPLAPVPSALAEAFGGLARRGVPLAPVRAFVELVVQQVHDVLAGVEPGDGGERAERDALLAVRLLERCYEGGGGVSGAAGLRVADG